MSESVLSFYHVHTRDQIGVARLSCLTSSCLCVWEQEGASQSHRHQSLAGTSILPCCNHTFLPKAFPTHNNLDTYQLCAPYKPSREARCTCKSYPSSWFFPRVKWDTSFCAWGVCSLEEVLGLTPALDKRSCLRGNTVKPLQVTLSESLPDVLGGHSFPFSGYWWLGTYAGPYLLAGVRCCRLQDCFMFSYRVTSFWAQGGHPPFLSGLWPPLD